MRIPHLREAGAVILLAGLAYGGYRAYGWAYTNGYNAANVRAEKVIAEFAKAEADAQAKARKAERDRAAAIAEIAEQTEQDKRDAEQTESDVVAGLRNDNLRLRQHWQGCVATGRVSGSAAAAALADANARLREADAGAAIGDAKRADDWIKRLQDYAREVSK